ncbi:hypothetical protein LLG90_08280 [Aromatoleum toluclasticum]|uniref:hypothetical protein n=1 Tax=Aromatoleum toluclasticum TaxID=92003 RepID=UPI001D19509F|nr:hypothetical protein [Aromatoleum toluclasticum]MCC4115341.1 hypothetical protein [Aromatoleum toluclasticum]
MTTIPKNEKPAGQGGSHVKGDWTTQQFYASQAEPASLPIVANPREWRALMALCVRDLTREQMDRTAGASNSPDLMKRCRERYGLSIPCVKEGVLDRDGLEVQRGVYRPTAADRRRIRQLLSRRGMQ